MADEQIQNVFDSPAPGSRGERTALLSGVTLCLFSMSSVQVGAALSAGVIAQHGPFATSFVRLLFASLILLAILRPPIRSYSREQWKSALALGVTMAVMTVCFYAAIARIPLGLTVAVEFLGPLAVATLGLCGWRLVWPLAAFVGVGLLCHNGESWSADPLGLLLAAGAGAGWGGYILLMKKSGKLFPGLEGLAISLFVSAIACLPAGMQELPRMFSAEMLLTMLGLAVLVPLLPYALEMIALRRMPTAAFGILMSLEPAIGALAGFTILGQPMTPLQMLGIGLVVAASVGVTSNARSEAG